MIADRQNGLDHLWPIEVRTKGEQGREREREG